MCWKFDYVIIPVEVGVPPDGSIILFPACRTFIPTNLKIISVIPDALPMGQIMTYKKKEINERTRGLEIKVAFEILEYGDARLKYKSGRRVG